MKQIYRTHASHSAIEPGNAPFFVLAIFALVSLFDTSVVYAQGFRDVTADTWLQEAAANSNNGSDKVLTVKNTAGESFRTIFQYDLTGLPLNANVTIAEAWFWVTGKDNSGDPVNIYRITDSWSENTATWNNTGADYDSSTVVASFIPDKTGWQKVDIVSLVQSWVCQEFNDDGLMLIATSSDTESTYRSKEASSAGQRPRLKLTTSGTNSCVTGVDHFVIVHDSYALHCLAETITVRAEDAAATPVTTYNQQVTLDTQSGFGSWVLVTGSGTLTDATIDDGIATYDWSAGESEAVFSLSYSQGMPIIDIDIYQTSDTLIRDDDSEGSIRFSASGFTVTESPLSNPPPGIIAPFTSPRIAGTDIGVYLAAFGQTPNDPDCGIIESYTGSQNLKFWFNRLDPATGTIGLTIDGSVVPNSEAAATDQAVVFTNGQAVVNARYKDAGRISIELRDDSLLHADLPTGIRGGTASFPVKPLRFVLSNIQDAGAAANPAAADALGPVFTVAGAPFSVTVTALDAEGSVTPNFGQENVAETVQLTSNLISPVAGNNPGISTLSGFGAFFSGSATGNNFTWSEVGIITLTPSIGDGDYLGGGDVSGTVSGNVGRFIPDHFNTGINEPQFSTQCGSGNFTYTGQSFAYSTAPLINFTAVAVSGSTTQNYSGDFFKITNLSLQNRSYAAASGMLDLSGLPPGTADPVISDGGTGNGTLLFSTGAGISFLRIATEPPFDADISVSIDLLDSDGVTALVNPVTVPTIDFDNSANIRYGRVRLINALGSELVNLAVPMRVEYFVDAASGFVTHGNDSCTDDVSLALGSFAGSLGAGETCVLDSGSPGDSGAGCAVPGPAGQRYREPPLAGDFNLYLLAPGDGNDGSTTVTADVPAWLEFDWDIGLPGLEDPSAAAAFGIYDGDGKRIYIRELY